MLFLTANVAEFIEQKSELLGRLYVVIKTLTSGF